jgi:DNA-binding NarL/FixJ family response regulator
VATAHDGAPIRIAVAERPAVLLEGLVELLLRSGLEVLSASTSPETLERFVRRDRPQIALVDASVGNGGPPLDFLTGVRAASPETRIVVLCDELTPALANAAMAHEVDGVVLGSTSGQALAGALEHVAAGHAVFPAGWLAAIHRAESGSLFARLSARQIEVLELLAAGLDNRRIAERLHISRNTVKFHVRVIYERLDVTNRVQAAAVLSEGLAVNGVTHAHGSSPSGAVAVTAT